jgi:vancomycin resistance protein VanJ
MTAARAALRLLGTDRGLRWTILPVLVLLASLVTLAFPARDGPLALFEALAPVAYGALLLLLALAAWVRSPGLAVVTAAVVAFGVVAYGPPSDSSPAPDPPTITVMTWNLHGGGLGEMGFTSVLEQVNPDVIVLEEARLRRVDLPLVERWQSRIELPFAATPPGMVILSRLPIDAHGVVDQPSAAWDRTRAAWIRIALAGRTVTIVGVHLTFPLASFPCPYCPEARDGEVRALATYAAQAIGSGNRLVIMGDFNLTEREPAYRDLAAVLADAGASAGATWRPVGVEAAPPVLRLDHIFTSPGIVAGDSGVLCPGTRSDHCPLVATVGLGR